ncbi:hypothetical protein [Myxococcus xanthus]|uniref:hypothetical protein n=1 Tax=Myxococcus xanthus TaxID=34 RepID=UPI00157618FC|nr:hypothetical protein [Myxococcus xanthus]
MPASPPHSQALRARVRGWARALWPFLVCGVTPAMAAKPPIQRLPHLTCRAGYLDFEQLHGLPTVRAAIQQALAQHDPAALTFLTERIPEVLGEDAQAAHQVLDWADTAPAPEASVLMAGLREASAVRDARVAERLLTMAEQHASIDHRAQALQALETQARFGAPAQDRLMALARRSTAPQGMSLLAVRTLGWVMKNDFQAGGSEESYLTRLLTLARESEDRHVRALAVELAASLSVRLDARAVEQLAWVLESDTDANVRELAALALSDGRDTRAVLKHFSAAFPGEQRLCVRWALLRYTLRASGAEALPQVRDYAKQDRRFARDVADFQALYDAGHVDFDRLWLNKRVYHRCPEDVEARTP